MARPTRTRPRWSKRRSCRTCRRRRGSASDVVQRDRAEAVGVRHVAARGLQVSVAAQDDGSHRDIPAGPGFAIGTFSNGHRYSIAQTFTVEHGGTFYGAIVPFSETTGAPDGAVRWELRRWYPSIGYMGKLIACAAWEPVEMTYNALPADSVRLRPGTYALVLRAVEEQQAGNFWNVIATETDVYAGGELLQLQEDGGQWGAYEGQDLAGVLDVTGPDMLFIELSAG